MILFVDKDTTIFRSSSIRYRGWLYQYLIPLAGSQHVEARFLLVGAVKGINYFEVCFAVRADATLGGVV